MATIIGMEPSTGLMTLPYELRRQIYNDVFDSTRGALLRRPDDLQNINRAREIYNDATEDTEELEPKEIPIVSVSLLCVSSALHRDAKGSFYEMHIFHHSINSESPQHPFVYISTTEKTQEASLEAATVSLGPCLAFMTSVTLDYCTPWPSVCERKQLFEDDQEDQMYDEIDSEIAICLAYLYDHAPALQRLRIETLLFEWNSDPQFISVGSCWTACTNEHIHSLPASSMRKITTAMQQLLPRLHCLDFVIIAFDEQYQAIRGVLDGLAQWETGTHYWTRPGRDMFIDRPNVFTRGATLHPQMNHRIYKHLRSVLDIPAHPTPSHLSYRHLSSGRDAMKGEAQIGKCVLNEV